MGTVRQFAIVFQIDRNLKLEGPRRTLLQVRTLSEHLWRSRTILPGLFLVVICLFAVHPLSDSDQFYHLKVGQVIWETKSVPMYDIFTYTAPGVRWITHEWLAELVFYWAFLLGGHWGPIYLVAVMAALTMWLLYALAVEWGADRGIGALLIFLLGYLTLDWWLVRPQVFAYLSFALLIYALERHRRSHRHAYLYAGVLTVWFWANVNASFILGLVVIGLYGTLALLRKYVLHVFREGTNPGTPLAFGLAFAGATAMSLVNPNGYQVFLYSWYIQPVVKVIRIFEWQPILNYVGDPHIQLLVSLLLLGNLFAVFWFGVRRESRDLVWLGLTLGIGVMPFISVRHYPFWPLAITVPFLVGVSSALSKFLGRMERVWIYPLILAFGVFALCARVSAFPGFSVQQDPLPVLGAHFASRIGLQGPRFNLYDDGGYLIWQSWPQEKVFIDGRSEIFAGGPVQEFMDILNDSPNWDALVNDKYHINYFFLAYRPETVGRRVMPLVGKLISQRWALVYWDDSTLIYVRKTPQNEALIRQYALYYVSPFREASTITPGEIPAAKENLQKALAVAPHSQVLRNYCAQLPGGC